MHKINIAGIGSFLPGPPITNDIIANKFKIDKEWIELFIGTKSRHFSVDLTTGKVCFNLTDIGGKAAEKAIINAQIDPNDIDAIVLATATPDNLMPGTVNLIMERLSLNHKETYQLQSGCSGAIQAINFAYNLIKSGSKSTVLVIGGDVCNKFMNLKTDFSQLKSSEIINYVLFGDGAGAMILTNKETPNDISIEKIALTCSGKDKPAGQIIDWKGNNTDAADSLIFEDYKSIEMHVPVLTKETLVEMLFTTGWEISDITYLLPPQLSKVMTDSIVESLNLPNISIVNCIEHTGNNGNALPFLQLEKLMQLIKKNEKAIVIAIESSKWIKSGMAIYA